MLPLLALLRACFFPGIFDPSPVVTVREFVCVFFDLVPEVPPLKDRRLKSRRMRDQHMGIFATRMAVLASRMYQNVHIGENGCAKE